MAAAAPPPSPAIEKIRLVMINTAVDDDEVTVIHHNHVNYDAIRGFTPVLIRVSPARKRSGREVVGHVLLTWARVFHMPLRPNTPANHYHPLD